MRYSRPPAPKRRTRRGRRCRSVTVRRRRANQRRDRFRRRPLRRRSRKPCRSPSLGTSMSHQSAGDRCRRRGVPEGGRGSPGPRLEEMPDLDNGRTLREAFRRCPEPTRSHRQARIPSAPSSRCSRTEGKVPRDHESARGRERLSRQTSREPASDRRARPGLEETAAASQPVRAGTRGAFGSPRPLPSAARALPPRARSRPESIAQETAFSPEKSLPEPSRCGF